MQTNVIALDVGTKRIGVAIADLQLRFAHPLTTLDQDDSFMTKLRSLIADYQVEHIVVGLPRGLDGQETAQTKYARHFFDQITAELKLETSLQDEAATSIKAKAELEARGKPYAKGEVDALAATYILEDWLLMLRPNEQTSGGKYGAV